MFPFWTARVFELPGQLTALNLAPFPISPLFIDPQLKPRGKSIAMYFPSHIYPLQSLMISFSPWAANYWETPAPGWAVICGAADLHPLDLLSNSPSDTASFSPINSSVSFFSPTTECHPFLFLFPLCSLSCNDLHTASTLREERENNCSHTTKYIF